jgi:hypothetical protein
MKLESGKEPHPSRVLFIGQSKRLKHYYTPRVEYIQNDKVRVAGSDTARRIDPSIFNLILTQPP